MADELETLTASFDADISKFDKKLDQILGKFNSTSSGIEARNSQLVSRLNAKFGEISFGKLIAAAGVTAVFDKLIEGSKELADQTLNTSRALGYSTDTLQGLGIIARKSGIDQDSLTSSLEHFSAQVGQSQLKSTDFGKTMAALGVSLKNGPEAALLSLSDKLGNLPKAQQAAVAQLAFGRGGVGNLSWLADGSKNIQALIANFKQLGLIVPTDKLEKVQQIFDAWADIKTEALTGFIDGFSEFAGDIASPAFQAGVENFGKVMGEVSGFIVKMAPYLPIMIETFAALKGAQTGAKIGGSIGELFGPEGAAIGAGIGLTVGGVAGGYGSQRVLGSMGKGGAPAEIPKAAPTGPQQDLTGTLDADKAARTAARLADLNKQLDQQVQESAQKSFSSYASLVRAQNDAITDAAKGTAGYYDLQNKAIEQNTALDIENIYAARDAAIQSITDRQDAQIASLKAMGLSAAQYAAELKKVNDAAGQQEVNVAVDATNKVLEANAKKNQQLIQNDWQYQQNLQNLIEVNQTFRDGLDSIAVAGLHGFTSLKQAAADFLNQLAEMIIKIQVMQPLLNSLLGPQGTSGGGSLGGILGSLFGGGGDGGFAAINSAAGDAIKALGFANGGVFAPGRGSLPLKRFAGGGVSSNAAIFGEAGPEAAVPLPDGRSIPVSLRIPPPASRQGSEAPYLHFDLRGAVVTQDLLNQMNSIADSVSRNNSSAAIGQYDRHVLPGRVNQLGKDPRRRH